MRGEYWILLLMTAWGTVGKWTEPVQVIPSHNTFPSVFTDDWSGVSHVLWCQSPAPGKFGYRRLTPDNEVSEKVTFYWTAPCHLDYLILGPHDGKTVYIVYQGRRESHERTCTKKTPGGCEDVYFAESTDAGKTWKAPIAVPRSDMNDVMNRQYPKFLVDSDKRLWIFYRMSGFYEAPYSYVTRAHGSTIFSPERTLPIKVDTASVVMGEKSGHKAISIYYHKHEDSHTYRYYTVNNGVEWTGPEDVTNYCEKYDRFYVHPFADALAPYHLFVVCYTKSLEKYLRISSDFGKSWTDLKIPYVSPGYRHTIAGNHQKAGVWFVVAYHELYFLEVGSTEWKKIEVPTVPSSKHCDVLTNLFHPRSIWYWFNQDGPSHSSSFWVTKNGYIEQES